MLRLSVIAVVACLLASDALAEVSGYVTLTSDFVRRGVSQSDADPAFQLGVDIGFENGFIAGAWGSSVDNRSRAGQQHDIELNAYAGYGRDVGERWRLSGFFVAYSYPGMDTPFDYDYREYLVSANYNDRYWLEYAYAPDYYGTGDGAWNLEALGEWPMLRAWRVSGGIGHFDLTDVVGSRYTYWQLGITGDVGIANLDLRFHDTDRVVPFFSSTKTAKARIVVTLTIPF
jgi:uncharacterized protein (TIGR02001 family)